MFHPVAVFLMLFVAYSTEPDTIPYLLESSSSVVQDYVIVCKMCWSSPDKAKIRAVAFSAAVGCFELFVVNGRRLLSVKTIL